MQSNSIRLFIRSVGILLFITAIAKLISSWGSANILQNLDPIFLIPFRDVLWIASAFELTIAFFCLLSNRVDLQTGLVAWLATNLLLYRCAVWWSGYHRPCSCMGNLTDALHIPPQTADMAMKIILAYLLIGSYASLFWLWRQHRKAEGRMMNEEVRPDKAP